MTRTSFNESEVEIIAAFIRVTCNFLKIKDVTWTRSKISFEKFTAKRSVAHNDIAKCDRTFRNIWLKESYFLKMPYIEWFDTVLHELLHIKYPNYSENIIKKLTRSYTGISYKNN